MGSIGAGTGNAVELLRGQGMRMTPQRLAIVDEIMSTSGYIIPVTVIDRVQARVPGVSPSTVYRTLERLEQVGVLTHVHLESGVGYHRLEEVQHAHLTCARCGADLEMSRSSLRSLERLVERVHGKLERVAERLPTHLVVREDAHLLFGFLTVAQGGLGFAVPGAIGVKSPEP